MKIQRGWLLSKDPDTSKNIPFFVKVRNKDIVVTDAPAFEDVFTKIFSGSTYKLISQTPEASTYEVTHSRASKYYYKLYNDGSYKISAYVSGILNYGVFNNTVGGTINTKITLPYSFQNSNKGYDAYTGFENIPTVTVKPCYQAFRSSTDVSEPKTVFVDKLVECSVLVDYSHTSNIESFTDSTSTKVTVDDVISYATQVYHTIEIDFLSRTLTYLPYYPTSPTETESISDMINRGALNYYIEIKGRYK